MEGVCNGAGHVAAGAYDLSFQPPTVDYMLWVFSSTSNCDFSNLVGQYGGVYGTCESAL
jgi:hypothetical protein